MKRFLGLTVLILGISVPAHAQSTRGGGFSGVSTAGLPTASGTGSGGGGAGLGPVSFPTLPTIAPARLGATAVSGSNTTFEPSTFLSFSQAVAAGQAVLDAEHKSVAEAAAENNRAHKLKAKAAMIENAAGDAVITTP
ncbi:MAG TPA: hypothetical protein VMB02_14180 [Candidatus Aquilonibacter sp.]|nr:hypothetical protein [Candidatus Aquilonibacter sp.]